MKFRQNMLRMLKGIININTVAKKYQFFSEKTAFSPLKCFNFLNSKFRLEALLLNLPFFNKNIFCAGIFISNTFS